MPQPSAEGLLGVIEPLHAVSDGSNGRAKRVPPFGSPSANGHCQSFGRAHFACARPPYRSLPVPSETRAHSSGAEYDAYILRERRMIA